MSVLGQVNRPGRFPLETLSRVSDMLAMAGGATPTGDDSAIVIGMRDGKPFRKVIDIPGLYLGEKSDAGYYSLRRRRDLRPSCTRFLYLW